MLVVSINSQDYSEAWRLINSLPHEVNAVELRLDYWNKLDISSVFKLRQSFSIPMIFTLRKKSQGGYYKKNEKKRLKDIELLCQCHPDFIDLEYDINRSFLSEIHKRFPKIKIITSYHNFNTTPKNLWLILDKMINSYASIYKLATHAKTTIDALRMLEFNKSVTSIKLSCICMGEAGHITRILGPVFRGALTYANLCEELSTAPGQLAVNELIKIYNYGQLNKNTKIYALLGDPVNKSVGHLLHNQALKIIGKNAIYIKLKSSTRQVGKIVDFCRKFSFSGLSVTMPLKEKIISSLDYIENTAKYFGSINTVVRLKRKLYGINTDGEGAINILKQKIDFRDKYVVILGAGGSARSIAYIAIKCGAKVIILNRTKSKAINLAKLFGCVGGGLDEMPCIKRIGYDVIINTLPIFEIENAKQYKLIIKRDYFISGTIAMDIIYRPYETYFLKLAKEANCMCIPGYEMFISQAILQITHWHDINYRTINKIKNMMLQYFIKQNWH